jgi:hypothetical protein
MYSVMPDEASRKEESANMPPVDDRGWLVNNDEFEGHTI